MQSSDLIEQACGRSTVRGGGRSTRVPQQGVSVHGCGEPRACGGPFKNSAVFFQLSFPRHHANTRVGAPASSRLASVLQHRPAAAPPRQHSASTLDPLVHRGRVLGEELCPSDLACRRHKHASLRLSFETSFKLSKAVPFIAVCPSRQLSMRLCILSIAASLGG